MQWHSALTRNLDLDDAIDELAESCGQALGVAPDLVFVFVSPHYRAHYAGLSAALRARLAARVLLGCSANGVIAAGEEIEQRAALGIVAAVLPAVDIETWHLEADDLGPGTSHSQRLARLAGLGSSPQILLLADPFSFPAERVLRSFDQALPRAVIAGGLASGGQEPGELALFKDDRAYHSGALVVSLAGDIEMVTAVAQGCRPIGQPMFVSACEGGRLTGLDGRPPFEVLNDVYAAAAPGDRKLMQDSLFLGIAMRAGESRYAQGDYLIRNVVGADPDSGALWIGAELRERQVVQFHLRDSAASSADLDQVLTTLHDALGTRGASGGLLFSCTGRGAGLYGAPDHDSNAFIDKLGEVPLGGFFCNGEIGQVGGQTYVHGYTSAFAVFRPLADA